MRWRCSLRSGLVLLLPVPPLRRLLTPSGAQTYDGWDQANYVGKDVKAGKLPAMINVSMATVVSLFILANVSYFIVLPYSVAIASSTIGLDFGRAVAGPVGGLLFALVVALSCIGALNGSLITSS